MQRTILLLAFQWSLAASFSASTLLVCRPHRPWASTQMSESNLKQQVIQKINEEDTVRTFEYPGSNQKVTLIGTAHLSEQSNQLVKEIIESTEPDVVMVEVDEKRLPRIGFESAAELGKPVCTADGIECPPSPDDLEAEANKPWWSFAEDVFLDGFTAVARGFMSKQYDVMGKAMGDVQPGGEFLAAIKAAQASPACERIVLGDRDSLLTLKRAGQLALRSGNPLGVFARFNQISSEVMSKLEAEVRKDLSGQDDAVINVAIVERMKSDSSMRLQVLERLENEVSEFMRSFVVERDYIMAQVILREQKKGAKHVVAVVGANHLAGMAKLLEEHGQ